MNKDTEYKCFSKELKELIGVNIMQYKEEQMQRRLSNYMRKNNFRNYRELIAEVKMNKESLSKLEEYLTINVTHFLRNEKFWWELLDKIVPKMNLNKKIKVWSAACSTGEEPYTIAILLKEKFPSLTFEVVATDLDKEVLKTAIKGEYRKEDIEVFGKGIIYKYFEKIDENIYKIKSVIKDLVKFEKHNLLNDPYKREMDIIICRNVMIYFKEEAKIEMFEKFSSSLVEGGVLFIGATEQLYYPVNYNLEMLQSFFYRKCKSG